MDKMTFGNNPEGFRDPVIGTFSGMVGDTNGENLYSW
jgi:hypothetical protein